MTEKCPVLDIGTCPADEYQFHCLNGSCEICPENCRITDCPLATPVQCPDYSCAKTLVDCPCPEGTIRCPKTPLECHTDVELCPVEYSQCPFYIPIRCANGACIARGGTCPHTDGCSENSQLCPHETNNQPACVLRTSSCKYWNDCPSASPYLCPTGQCVTDLQYCPPPTDCTDSRLPYRCAGGVCASSTANCVAPPDPLDVPCPWNAPFLCSNGVCVEYEWMCPAIYNCSCKTQATEGVCQIPDNNTCPAGWTRCSGGVADGMCVSSQSYCPNAYGCPASSPIRCPCGECVSDASYCNTYCPGYVDSGCTSSAPYRCSWGYCVANYSACPSWNYCPTTLPYRCWDGSCRAQPADCPAYYCQAPNVTCVTGQCVTDRSQCIDCTGCSGATRARCADGNCVADYSSCPATVMCGAGQVLCPSGVCMDRSSNASNAWANCPSVYPCAAGQVRCADGSCAASKASCPISCPASSPVMCENHACVAKAAMCGWVNISGWCGTGRFGGGGGGWGGSGSDYWGGSGNCPANASYVCFDGLCATSPVACQANTTACPTTAPYRCADGRCVADSEGCPIGDACSQALPRRCWDGSCVALDAECSAEPACPTGQVHCPDGQCHSGTCPNYNGCTAQQPILCPDGTCGTEEEDCMTACDGGLYHCDDGRCETNFTMCNIPASQEKTGCMRYTQDITGTRMAIPSANGTLELGQLRVPPSTIIIKSTSTTTLPAVRICSVADSVIRAYTGNVSFIATPLVEISTQSGISTPFPNNQKVTLRLRPAVPIEPSAVSDYCLAVIDEASHNFTCVDTNVKVGTDSSGNQILQGTISSLTASENMFMFIQKSGGAGAHCGGSTPYTCSDGTCQPSVAGCLKPVPSAASRVVMPLAAALAALALAAL